MSSRDALEAAIEQDPSDRQAYAVLADHLQELGDPRGELIALQLSGTSGHAVLAIITALGQPPGVRFHYELGYARSAVIDPGTAKGTRDTLEHPSCRFLVELTVGHNTAPLAGSIKAIAAALRPTLRILRLGAHSSDGRFGSLERELGDMTALWAALPRLEELTLLGQSAQFGDIDSSTLKHFDLSTALLSAAMAKSLAKARWPALAHLRLNCASTVNKPDAKTLRWLGELFARDLPALRELHVEQLVDADKLIGILAKSPLLSRLTSLTFSHGDMTDAGAQTILSKREAFAHLTTFDVEWNEISDAAMESLRQAFPAMKPAEDDDHYEDADE